MARNPRVAMAARLALVSACTALLAAPASAMLPEAGGVHPPYTTVGPPRSSVIFSSRFTRPEAIPVIKAFGATRVEWVYTKDAAFASALKSVAPWFGGALNANGPLPSDDGYARDFDGAILGPPWMKGWGGRWVTTTHPQTQAAYEARVKEMLALGVSSIQYDDPQLQAFPALKQGGDFNESTVRGFPRWLATQASLAQVQAAGLTDFTGDYRLWLHETHGVKDTADYTARFRKLPSTALWMDYVRSTVAEHFIRLRAFAARERGRPVPISMNLSALYEPLASNPFFFLAPLTDYAIAETHIDNFPQMASQLATARALGIGFVPSILPLSRAENRVGIATLYALGGPALVPWDVYNGNDERGMAKRFFGTIEDYGDLYRFVRLEPQLFDGLETAAVVGLVVPVDKGRVDRIRALVKRLTDRNIPFAFVPVGRNGHAAYQIDPSRIKPLKLLVIMNPESDYAAVDREAWAASGVALVQADRLRDDGLGALQPFVVAPGAERMRLVPRSDPRDPNRLVVHIVDASRGDELAVDGDCRRRIGIHRKHLGDREVQSIDWHSPITGAKLAAMDDGPVIFVTLQGCAVWGALDIRLRNAVKKR